MKLTTPAQEISAEELTVVRMIGYDSEFSLIIIFTKAGSFEQNFGNN